MLRKIEALTDRHGMLPAGATVLCAVSGGADSVCLLHVLKRFGRDLRLVCAHYNHRLRGPEADRDEAFVKSLCEEIGIPLTVGGGDVAAFAKENGMGTEEAARALRYAFLEQAADAFGAGRIATAHTSDDNAETLLINLARGTGLRGLGGIPPVRGRIVRPLLTVTRREVEAYLLENGLPHVEDSTNRRDDYARNRLRHAVLPVLTELNENFLQNAANTTRLNREDEAFLTALAEEFVSRHAPEDGMAALPLQELLALPGPVASRVFRILAGGSLSLLHTEALFALCRSDNPSAEIRLPGVTVRREYEKLIFGVKASAVLRMRTLEPGQYLELPEAGLALRCDLLPSCKGFHSSFNTFFFQYEKICGKLLLKSRSEGETISLLGRQGTHSIKKLMIDAKIPRWKRSLVPVIADDLGPLALYGFGQAKRCAAVPGESAIKVELIPMQMKGAAAT